MRAPASRAARYALGRFELRPREHGPARRRPGYGLRGDGIGGERAVGAEQRHSHARGEPRRAERDRCAPLHARAGARARREFTAFIRGRSTHSQLAVPAASASGATRAASSTAVGVVAVIALTNRMSGTCQR